MISVSEILFQCDRQIIRVYKIIIAHNSQILKKVNSVFKLIFSIINAFGQCIFLEIGTESVSNNIMQT